MSVTTEIALRYLRPKRAEGFVSVIAGFSFFGILLGVGTLIVVMSVLNGFRAKLEGLLLGLNAHVEVTGLAGRVADWPDAVQRIRTVPGVLSALPVVQAEGVLRIRTGEGRDGYKGVGIRGYGVSDFNARPEFGGGVRGGSLEAWQTPSADGEAPPVALGFRLAQSLGLEAGDRIRLVSPQRVMTPFGEGPPRELAYRVVALIDSGFFPYDANMVYMPLETAQSFTGLGERVSILEVFLDDATRNLQARRDAIQATLGAAWRVASWQDLRGSYFNALAVERTMMSLIVGIILVVAAFNIASGLIMLVKDKTRDVAVLRTMGASQGRILRIFLTNGLAIGVTGTLAGFVIAVIFCENIEAIRQFVSAVAGTEVFDPQLYYLSELPAEIDWNQVLATVGASLSLTVLAALYPAWRASRLDPVAALRSG